MSRPVLTPQLSAAEFRSFYWLKDELLAFCRANQLSTRGSKQDLAERIAVFLASGERLLPQSPPRNRTLSSMPTTFTLDSIIGPGWRCSEPLRVFFQSELGPRFHFDQVMRDFIKNGAGKTLADAIAAWKQPRQPTEIAPQFEYNRYLRAFFLAHPSATREDAIRSWKEAKALQRTPGEE